MKNTRNTLMLNQVANRLKPLLEQLVFVGGATVDLLLTDNAAQTARPTEDVDTIINVTSKHAYDQISQILMTLGWQNDTESGVICRWVQDGLILDVMPTKEEILSFSNPWYPQAIENSQRHELESNEIFANSAPYFIASKLVAWKQRGQLDYMTSKDLEDIVLVFDGRIELVAEIKNSKANVQAFIAAELTVLLEDQQFLELIEGFVPYDQPERALVLVKRMKAVSLP
jgi:predicted nucleotidyltransferase